MENVGTHRAIRDVATQEGASKSNPPIIMTNSLNTSSIPPLFTPDTAREAAESVIDKAESVTHRAADAAVDRLVRPAVNATRDAAIALESRVADASHFLTDALRTVEDEVHTRPVRTLGYAVGIGVLIGFWIRWR